MTARDVYWLGVHKTGTTFLQACLKASRSALERHGTSYQSLNDFRNAHTRPLLDRPAQPPQALPRDNGRRLIFDENILGLVQDVASLEGLYPTGAWRADEMADRLDLRHPHLVLGLRGFADFLPSLYCEALKSTPFRSFREFQQVPQDRLSWIPLVRGLLRAFPGAPITLYAAERLRGHETRLLSHLLNIPVDELRRADHSDRPGFSQQAVDMMTAAHAAGEIGPDGVKRLAADYPRGAGRPGFDPWSPEERSRLDMLYEADLKALRHLPRVSFVDPAKL